ncbi:unnamed protein product [Cochlearia groenlandica]
MTKATFLTIFLVVLVLGMMTEETQGQEMCHDYIRYPEGCIPERCHQDCRMKHPTGGGDCMPSSKTCQCGYPC